MLTAEPIAYGSNWYAATRAASRTRAPLTFDLDVDVCVVGAGLAGLTVAYELARRGWSVVLLEAQSVAWNASGRNAGVVRPGFAIDAEALVARVGLDDARALWALSEAGAEYVRAAARGPTMAEVALSETGWLHVARTDDAARMAAEGALLGDFGATVEPWPADRVREMLRSPRYFHALHHPRGFSLHPLNYALGLAAAAEAAGARIYEATPVREIDAAGVRKRLVTPNARVRAGHVVLAGGVPLAGLVPRLAGTLLPGYRTAVVTAPLGERLREAIGYAGAISDTPAADRFHRVVDGDRLMWCGEETAWRGNPERAAVGLLREIRRIYPALGDAKAEFTWTAELGSTVHGMPQIGELSPGVWVLSGFGSHGLNATAIGGELIARAIVEGDRTWQRFEPFALVWGGGTLGRAARQLCAWATRRREDVRGALARRRDKRRLRAEQGRAIPASPAPVQPPIEEQTAPASPPAVSARPVEPEAQEVPKPKRKRTPKRKPKPTSEAESARERKPKRTRARTKGKRQRVATAALVKQPAES